MFNDLTALNELNIFSLSAAEIAFRLLAALIAGILISYIFRKVYKGAGYTSGFLSALILLTLITCLVIMVIGNNLAIAFGLVGALSIIRFRTAVKDVMDIVFIFFALAAGMAAGAGYFKITAIGVLFIGGTAYIISRTSLVNYGKEEFLLQFIYSPNGETEAGYLEALNKYCRSQKLINIKSIDSDSDRVDIAYYIKLKSKRDSTELISSLKKTKGVSSINIYLEDDTI